MNVEADYHKLPNTEEGEPFSPVKAISPNGSSKEQEKPQTIAKPEPKKELTSFDRLKVNLEALIESSYWSSFMTLVTIWTLFQTDIKYAATGVEADAGFEAVISIFFFLFIFEITAQSIYKEDYFILPNWEAEPGETQYETWVRRCSVGSFYFWMDVVATSSIILDMKWIIGTKGIVSINGGGNQAASGGQAAKSGSRLGRLIRLVRMVRLTRLAKLYKYAYAVLTGKKVDSDEEDDFESRVGAAMSDLTNRR
jgi:hypothetical protein